jgi:FSR family fosmidomycin resistance protein-like MFS transporter
MSAVVLLHVAVDAGMGATAIQIPLLADRLDMAPGDQAALFVTLTITSLGTQPVMGGLADRFGDRRLMALGAVVAATSLSLLTMSSDLATAHGLLALGGLGLATFHPAASVLVRRLAAAKRELAIGAFAGAGTLGVALGPPLLVGVIAPDNHPTSLWLTVPTLVLAIAVLGLVPRSAAPPRPRHRAVISSRLKLMTAAGVLAATASITFTAGLPRWMAERRDLDPADPLIGWTLAAFSAAGAVAGLVAGWRWSQRRPSRLMAGTLALAGIPLVGTLITSPASPAFFAMVSAAGFLLGAGVPATVSVTAWLAPDDVARATGIVLGLTGGLAGVLYLLIGQAQEHIGVTPALAAGFIGVVPAATLTIAALSCGPGGMRARLSPMRLCACPVPFAN